MRRILRWAIGLPCGVVVLFFALYLSLVYPNDNRVRLASPWSGVSNAQSAVRKGSLLISEWEHRLDRGERPSPAHISAMVPENTLFRSLRFVSPYQLFVPVGRYPSRLDARDAIYIPAGATLEMTPPNLSADLALELRLGLFGGSERAFLEIGIVEAVAQPREQGAEEHQGSPRHVERGGAYSAVSEDRSGLGNAAIGVVQPLLGETQSLLRLQYVPAPAGPAQESIFYQFVGRYLDVDPEEDIPRWADAKIPLNASTGARLRLSCRSEGLGCVVSDPTLYAHDSTPARNFLVLLVDTLRGDAVENGHAPVITELAVAGTNFRRALAPGNMTSPSTNAFLACRNPSAMGKVAFAYTLSPEHREVWYARDLPSFPARFTEAGYDTAMIGNVSVISEVYGVGVNHGFTEQLSLETDGYDTPRIAREAVAWLRDHGSHKFLLYVHFNGPHAPYRAPWRDIASTWPGFAGLAGYPEALRWLYQAEVAYTDRYIKEVLSALDQLDLSKRTTIVLTADHGDQHRERLFAGNAGGKDFRGAFFDHGATLYNDEIRVPLIIKDPDQAPRDVAATWVSTLDVGPTLLDLAGISGGKDCAGTSLRPLMDGRADRSDRVFGSEGFQGRAVVFDGHWKYIRSYGTTDKRVYTQGKWWGRKHQLLIPEQLFDLDADPDERNNLVGDAHALERARSVYRNYYAVKTRYELVVDPSGPLAFDVRFPLGTAVRIDDGPGEVTARKDGISVRGVGPMRAIIVVEAPTPAPIPKVYIGRRPVPVRETSMGLPIRVQPGALPIEAWGRSGLLHPALKPMAYLVRGDDDGRADRTLVVGNPVFEKVLRDWGYLNDR